MIHILSGGVLTLLDPGPEPGPDSLLAGPWPYQGAGAWSPALGSGHTRPKMWPVCVGGGLKVVRPMINLKCGRKIVSFRNAPPRLSHKKLHIPQKGFLKSRARDEKLSAECNALNNSFWACSYQRYLCCQSRPRDGWSDFLHPRESW